MRAYLVLSSSIYGIGQRNGERTWSLDGDRRFTSLREVAVGIGAATVGSATVGADIGSCEKPLKTEIIVKRNRVYVGGWWRRQCSERPRFSGDTRTTSRETGVRRVCHVGDILPPTAGAYFEAP